MQRRMRPGSVLVDIAIDQGGCAKTSRPTTHDKPVYMKEGVTHYCVANMPGAYQPTAAPLNQERHSLSELRPSTFAPRTSIDAPIKGSRAQCRCEVSRGSGFWLFKVPAPRHSARRDLRTVARRMEGVARPDSAGTVPAQRGTVRTIPGDGRQP